MSKYTFPNLSGFSILYKGRRYIAFSVGNANPFSGMEEFADFVVWDGLYDAAVSYGVITENGIYDGFLAFSHVEIEVDSATTISEFVKNSSSAQLQFFKDTGT